jgi:signal transduction histidine kinase
VVAVALEAEDSEARKLLALLPYGVIAVDREWHITFANAEAHRMLGQTGSTLWDLCPELEATSFGSAFRYAMGDRAELISESALPSVGWLQARARPYEAGLMITLRQIHPETSESFQGKQALLRGEIGVALTRGDPLPAMLHRCTESVMRHLDAVLARIWGYEADKQELVLQASTGDPPPETFDRVAIGRSKIGKIAERGAPFVTNDFANDPRAGNREWAQRAGITAFAGYPLRVGPKVVGVLAVYGRNRFGHDVTGALASIADSIALGIERKLSEDARQVAETELRTNAEQLELINEIGKNLTSEIELGPLVQRVTNLATRLAQAQFGAFFYNHHVERDGERLTQVAVSGIDREVLPLPVRPSQLTPGLFPKLPAASFLATPVYARGGRVVGALVFGHEEAGVFTEQTEKLISGVAAQAAIALDNAKLFMEAREAISALEKTNAELDQFAYVTSHDLKAPLRGIANLAQWIEDDLGDKMDDQARYHMGLLRGRVKRLEGLIDGILHYSRANRLEGAVVDIDTDALVHEIWELLAPPESATLVAASLPTITTMKIPLQQVLMNLMSNALKYNRDRELTIEVGAQLEDNKPPVFYVKDNGVGIAPEFHQRIWGLFQTLEARDKVESTGIGLAVVRKIVETRGGRAWIDSTPGAGATFWFTWPQDAKK